MTKEELIKKIIILDEEICSLSTKIELLSSKKQRLEKSVDLSAEDLVVLARKIDELEKKIAILDSVSDEKMESYLFFKSKKDNKYILRNAVLEMPEEMKPEFAKGIDYSTFSACKKREPKVLFGLFLGFIASVFVNVVCLTPLSLIASFALATMALSVALIPTKEEKNKRKIEKLDEGIENSDIVPTLVSLKQKSFIESIRNLIDATKEYNKMVSELTDIDINVMNELVRLADEIELLESYKESKEKQKSELEDCVDLISEEEIDIPKKLVFRSEHIQK